MKKTLKLISLLTALMIICSVFGGCGGPKDVSTGSTYSYWCSQNSNSAQTITSYNELMMYQEIEKKTGIKVDFVHPTSGTTGSEAFQILMASGNLPDMMEYSWKSYTGGPEQAIADGVIIALNEYMEDYAPNYYSVMEGKKAEENNFLYKPQATDDLGNYFGFCTLNLSSYSAFGGIMIRKDMLDDWGLDVPVTIDDWTNVFKVAKENGVKYPLTGGKEICAFNGRPMFENAWNVGKGFYVVNNKVKFGPFEKEYKDYLAQLTDWSKAGYLDIDFVTNDSNTIAAYMTNGSSVACFGYVGGTMGKFIAAMKDRDPDYNIVACPFPVMNEGDVPMFQDIMGNASDPTIAISVQCGAENEDRYKEAMKWCDYLYSDEGIILKSFGIENDTFTIEKNEDGSDKYVYTDRIYDFEKIGAHSVNASLYHFFRPATAPGFNQHPDYLDGFYEYEQQKDAIKTWNLYVDEARKYSFPPVSYTGEEATQKANIESMGRDNLNAAIFNIVLGKEKLEDYDKIVVKAAKKAGYDKLLKINQAAYDRYIAKTK